MKNAATGYGEVTIREALIRSKGRREKEIDDLVASRRQLRKRWRKAEESEKEGLKAHWMRSEDALLTSGGQNASEDGEKGRRRKDQVSSGIHSGMHAGSLRRRQVESWMSPKKNCRSTSALSTVTQQGIHP